MAVYNAYFSVPERELIAVLMLDESNETMTQERIDGEWQDLPPGDPNEFDYTLIDTIDESKLDEFLAVFDKAEEEFKTLVQSDVESFMKKREKPE